MTLTQTKTRGFTIVELLIVIVVIAILAAITIVAYNGITTRANASAAKGNATTLQKKMEAFTQVNPAGTPPASGTSLQTQLNTYTESAITGTGITATAAGADPTSANGKNTFRVKFCSAPVGATGFEIAYFDYSAGSGVQVVTGGGNTTACTTYGTNATP